MGAHDVIYVTGGYRVCHPYLNKSKQKQTRKTTNTRNKSGTSQKQKVNERNDKHTRSSSGLHCVVLNL